MYDLPDCDTQSAQSESRYCAAHPARGDSVLQTLESRPLGCVKEEKIVAPVTEAERRIPRQQGEHDTHLEAQDDIEDNAELCCHTCEW